MVIADGAGNQTVSQPIRAQGSPSTSNRNHGCQHLPSNTQQYIHRSTPIAKRARGPKKHLKRLNAPKHWMLDKLTGTYAPRPTAGPHKLRECLPLVILMRNRLKYALNGKEVQSILMQRLVKVDNK
ncbi:40S ribosomal protein S4, X isoform, partial [Linnemannia elongata]